VETMDLESSYRLCQQITRREAKNFYYAFITLPQRERRAIYAVYAFCREADDIADSNADIEEKCVELDRLRKRLAVSAAGDPQQPPDVALSDAIARYSIDPQDLAHVVDGVEMDLSITRYETFSDLSIYCYRVASAVGLSVLPILAGGKHLSGDARKAGETLGLGMQLANIVRDVAEDIERDRVYLPQEDLQRFGVKEETLLSGAMNQEMRELIAFEIERSRNYISQGRRVADYLPRRSRSCPILLATIYSRILDMAEARDYDVLSERLSLSTTEKLLLILRAWAGMLR
jgi:15-cis-phytoene synthase